MARGRKTGWSTAAQEIVDRLFVYGTLRSGETARSMIAEHISGSVPGTAYGSIYAFEEGYAGFIAGGDNLVVGEIVTLADLAAAFPLLDAYEGQDYQRVLIKANTSDGEEIWTWVYTLVDPTLAEQAQHIPSGDWANPDAA